MALIRPFVGSLVAAALGVAAIHLVELAAGTELGWLGILIGILVGLGTRLAAGAGAAHSPSRGALAALVCIGAFVLGPMVLAKVSPRHPGSGRATKVAPAQPGGQPRDLANIEVTPDLSAPPVEPRAGNPGVTDATANAKPTGELSALEIAYMVGAAALAYFIGGAGRSKRQLAEATTAIGEPPREGDAS